MGDGDNADAPCGYRPGLILPAKGKVTGDAEIIANIRRAYQSVGGRYLDDTLKNSLAPMREQTEINARLRRQMGYSPPGGHLDQGVVIRKTEASGLYHRIYWVSFAKRARKIAHLVEFGTAPHYQPLRRMMHPGAQPYPFFRPAFESTKHEVVDEVGIQVWNRINGSLIGSLRKR